MTRVKQACEQLQHHTRHLGVPTVRKQRKRACDDTVAPYIVAEGNMTLA